MYESEKSNKKSDNLKGKKKLGGKRNPNLLNKKLIGYDRRLIYCIFISRPRSPSRHNTPSYATGPQSLRKKTGKKSEKSEKITKKKSEEEIYGESEIGRELGGAERKGGDGRGDGEGRRASEAAAAVHGFCVWEKPVTTWKNEW